MGPHGVSGYWLPVISLSFRTPSGLASAAEQLGGDYYHVSVYS